MPEKSPSPRSLGSLPLLVAGFCSFVSAVPGAMKGPEHPGAAIYKKLCAECHGDRGQGVDGKFDDPLSGERSLEQLARKIEKTMPEDNEGACVGEDARQVAAYIYDAFYSPAAQARNHPPEKDLTRLTIEQHRTSIMDLIGHFRQGPGFDRPLNAETGLHGTYRGVALPKPGEPAVDTTPKQGIKAKRPNFKFDRVDPVLRFHFGADSPDKATMEAEQFSEHWEGSVVADETGVYEFIIKTENGARLWINSDSTDDGSALIDAWVSAGPEVREEKKSIFLVGGRAYHLVLDHFKFKEKSASIELWWKPPHGVEELIPQRALRTDRPRELYVVSSNFPADDRSVGYERGSTISKDWDRAVTEAAINAGEYVESHLDQLAGTKPDAPDRLEKLRRFTDEFVSTAFRRPVTAEERKVFIEPQFATAKSPEQAVKRVVLFTLKSPQFLYPEISEAGCTPDQIVASRLALSLWDSLPSRELIKAAAEGKLHTRDEVTAQVQRMIADPRTKAKVHGFFHHWLDMEHAENSSKDPKAFPGFGQDVMADLRTSLWLFIDDVVWSAKSDYRELLKADYLLLNDRLAKFYGTEDPGDGFQRVTFDPKQRAGVVTHPYLLASMAYSKQTSPIHRGVFLTRNIVGMALKPPPMAVAFDESHFNPNLTMREKITELTRNNNCMSCHGVINPLGFSLENFDAIGRWRTKDNNKPVNSVSEFANEEGRTVRLTGPRDIVNYVADNPSGHRAFIRNLFNHTVKQQIAAYGPTVLDDLQKSFAASDCSIQKLLAQIAIVDALHGIPAAPPQDVTNR